MPFISSAFAVATTLLALHAPAKSRALTVIINVDPKHIAELPYGFDFSSRDENGVRRFAIRVSEKKVPFTAGLIARVHLTAGGKEVATIPLELTWNAGKATYWFDVSPNLSADAQFEFSALTGSEESDGHGHKVFIGVVGHTEYHFRMGDFASRP